MPKALSRLLTFGAASGIFLLVLWGLVTPWGLGLDFANFHDIGHKMRWGEYQNLYDHRALIGGKEPLGQMKFLGLPISAFLYSPLAYFPPHTGLFLFKLAGTGAIFGGLVLIYRRYRPLAARADYLALFLAAAVLWQPFWTIYRVGGQTTPFVFLLLVLGQTAYLRRQMVATALIVSAAVMVKPVLAPMAILLFAASGNRFRATALVVMALSAAASLALFGWDLHQVFLDKLGQQNNRMLAPWTNSSPVSWVSALIIDPAVYGTDQVIGADHARLLNFLRLLVSSFLVFVMIGHLRRDLPSHAQRHVIYLTGVLLAVSMSPVVWAHYLMFLFPLVAILIAGRRFLPRLALALLIVALGVALFQSYILVRQIDLRFAIDTIAKATVFGFVKSLPAILILSIWGVWVREIARILSEPAMSLQGVWRRE